MGEPSGRALWIERLKPRLDPREVEMRRLSHEVVVIQAHFGEYAELDEEERERELERVLAGLGERVGIGPPPAR